LPDRFFCPEDLLSPSMRFNDIIGQGEIKQQLAEMVQHNRLSHALLFLGKEGSGDLSLALAFAQYVVCEKVNGRFTGSASSTIGPSLFGDEIPPEPASIPFDSCGTCPSCLKAQELVHPDIHFSYPVVTKKSGSPPLSTDYITEWREFIKSYPYGNTYDWLQFIGAENKQGNITAHECNDIIRKLNLKSFESEYKILLMWMPEYLGNEGNKLLKLIEEPPPNTLFVLVAQNESLILPTILSRCQLVKIPALETSDIEEALVSRHKTETAVARQVGGVSEGNYREALQLVQHADEDWQGLLKEWLNAILKTGPIAQTRWVEEISRLGREKQKQFLRYFNHVLQQAIRYRLMGNNMGDRGTLRLSAAEMDFAEKLNRKIADIGQQEALIEELDRASYYIERNANAKILFHALTIKVYHIIQDKIVFLTD
jgi:DNA polymerase-3 subunit delta'